MHWTDDFQLFLFDFDGLLVNTERLHFQAYINMLTQQGFDLTWSFAEFCHHAHRNASALKEALYLQFPGLDPNWNHLYAEKKKAYLELLNSGRIEFMPGVPTLLNILQEKGIRRCVATNSTREQVDLISTQLPLLKTIPHWITREQYANPKPDPECYLKAIQLYGKKGDRIIGFEDSLRGLEALKQTPALAVLIRPSYYPLLEIAAKENVVHYESFEKIPQLKIPL